MKSVVREGSIFSFSLTNHKKEPGHVGVYDRSLEELPVAVRYNRPRPGKRSIPQFPSFRKAPTCSCPNVLIVDDNEFNIYTLKLLLEMCGLKASPDMAHNGFQAIDSVSTRAKLACPKQACSGYTVVFMDCNMPVMDGF